ncbi:MAG: redoxin domain-containing protein [Chloroflexi bacterium]|nr:redoxin domain-containing protein [Chloroflexota bacterium]MCI0578492.1 redoxin domain-containing protein [Chloroflexota bacterium]MCI0648491.1 redoxin domain-containing protein [Chloroflexota bacterium]MCI0726015.1 redoxin domain-containing protein [Chloroflexota bacterium]
MSERLLNRPIVRMPEFAEGEWLNRPRPLSRAELRGQVVLVDFWDYTCINCIRTLPYLSRWHERYADKGLTIVGVHAPEFKFARARPQIEAAIEEFGIRYPVLLDNEYQTWERFANRAWPSKHLVDTEGYIRYHRQGEGYYAETEEAIQTLLRRRDPAVSLPEVLPPLRGEDTPGAVCYRPTPELYAGYQGGGLFGGALGNPEGYVTGGTMAYTLPEAAKRERGHFYVEGFWRAEPEAMVYAGQEGGRIVLPYRAAGVNVVMSPSSDPVALALNLWPGDWPSLVEVRQDGGPLTPVTAGVDVTFDSQGRSQIVADRPRLVALVQNPDYEAHELELIFHASGLAVYAFTFTICVTTPGAVQNRGFNEDTFRVK